MPIHRVRSRRFLWLTREAVWALAACVVALACAGFLLARALAPSGAESAAKDFLRDWGAGRDAAAGERTDRPRLAARALADNRDGLDGAALQTKLLEFEEKGSRATARLRLVWDVPRIGRWRYETKAALERTGDEWRLRWDPRLVHPALDRVTRLGTTSIPEERGTISDRAGRPLMTDRPVVRVGAVAGDVDDPAATARGLSEVLGVEAPPIERTIRGGGEEQFVEALALRPDDYAQVRAAIDAVPDASSVEGTAVLAPSREFARAMLGAVAPATAEQLEKLGADYVPGDSVGQWGLQARFERRLAGVPTRRVVIRANAAPIETLHEKKGRSGRPLQTTLDRRVQAAAEEALVDQSDEAALVAVQPSSGDVLAVANRPVDSTYNRALEGTYPPGSSFKVVSTAALLRDGLSTEETVNCPTTIDAGGRLFKNFEGGSQGSVPFSLDFAQSCNTAFVSLADRLPPEALGKTARDYGLGRTLDLEVEASNGQVPPGRDEVERAAAMIGQHEILASPLTMAGVAATVAEGRWRSPRLLPSDPRKRGPELDSEERDTLRSLMRSVVTSGTGTALSGVSGEVGGKSGTAEFGGGDPPPTHAWFIAFREDLALAVLVERGSSGGAVAAPIAARFFAALDQ
ncbi:MAG: penicillin-binding transpeptidase domain-containing protein [Solirubrobacteraceae bacterium]